jgi:hypothetical protein
MDRFRHSSATPRRAACPPLLWAAALVVALAGCGGGEEAAPEVKAIDEIVTEQEVESLLRIVNRLPDKKLPPLPAYFAPLPDWNPTRTLPVSGLVREEQAAQLDRRDERLIAGTLARQRGLARALKREKLTPEQFIGLAYAIGVAISGNTIKSNQDLSEVIASGREAVAKLEKDERTYASLAPEQKYEVARQSVWITRLDRAVQLKRIPPENLDLVRRFDEQLRPLFSPEYTTNPIDAVVDRLTAEGLPFEELATSGRDSELEWEPSEALIGRDPADNPQAKNDAAAAESVVPAVKR